MTQPLVGKNTDWRTIVQSKIKWTLVFWFIYVGIKERLSNIRIEFSAKSNRIVTFVIIRSLESGKEEEGHSGVLEGFS